jgi:glucose/arabinose dehydrogenase
VTVLGRTPATLVLLAAVALGVAGCADVTDQVADPPPVDDPTVRTVPTGLDVDQPIALVPAPQGDALLVAQRGGEVVQATPDGDDLVAAGRPVIDLTERVGSTDGERGLLGLAVAPDGEHLYASYTAAADGASQVDEFELVESAGSWTADPDTRRNLVDVAQPYENHNGGHLEFGPDGMLYLGLGDGGSGGDPEGRAQDPGTLLGKLLRLDPEVDPPVPADNPFVGDDPLGARDEIWATGLRNPWRFSFDRGTGDLWIGDVGQDRTEEIDLLPAADGGGRGANLGWDLFEGDEPFDDADPGPGAASDGPFVDPVFTYGHDQGCSVTGGVVYRGDELTSLRGTYLYADLCSSGIRALRPDGEGGFDPIQVTDGPEQVIGFAQDRDGEVYVLSLSAGVVQLSTG